MTRFPQTWETTYKGYLDDDESENVLTTKAWPQITRVP